MRGTNEAVHNRPDKPEFAPGQFGVVVVSLILLASSVCIEIAFKMGGAPVVALPVGIGALVGFIICLYKTIAMFRRRISKGVSFPIAWHYLIFSFFLGAAGLFRQ